MGLALTLGGIATAILLALAIPAVRDALTDSLHGNTDQVRHDLREAGASGVLMVFVLGMLHAVIWYPAEILDAAAGYVYGFGPAMPLIMVTWVASGLAAYYIGRHAARPVLYRLAGEERFERMEALVERGGVSFLLACRLVPIVPFSLTGLVAGAAHVPVVRFTWTTAVGYLPLTAYFVYVGSQVESFSAEDPILWIGGIALIIAILFARRVIPADRKAPPRGGGPEPES
jgi:uncharacterized membrane protein YdjX (TVP38/TMEM64 family)